MEAGTHAILVYDSKENKRDVLFNHLMMGVYTDGLVYACSEETPQEIRDELGSAGLDVEGLEENGILSVKNYDEVYIVDGVVNSTRIISGFSDLAWQYTRKGLGGVRASGEMSCFFKQGKVDQLLEYENALHRKLSFPGRGVCAYNLVEMGNVDSLDFVWPILRAHSLVIMTGPNGSFALEPEKVTKEDVEGAMGVDV